MLNIPPLIIASALVLLAEMCFAGVSALVKHASAQIPFEHLVFFRNLFALIVLLPWLYRKRATAFQTEQFGLHILRAVFGIAAMYLFFLVIATIPLAQATLVLLLAPFLIPVISYFWLKEPIRPRLFATIALGFIGAYVFLNPAEQTLHPMVAVAFVAAVFAAWTKTMIRKLATTESPSKIVFYFSFFASIISFFPFILGWQPIPLSAWLAIFGIGLFAVIGQLAMTRAFSISPPSQVGVFTYSSVIFAALLGYIFWGEAITSYMGAGFLIILSAGYLTLKR